MPQVLLFESRKLRQRVRERRNQARVSELERSSPTQLLKQLAAETSTSLSQEVLASQEIEIQEGGTILILDSTIRQAGQRPTSEGITTRNPKRIRVRQFSGQRSGVPSQVRESSIVRSRASTFERRTNRAEKKLSSTRLYGKLARKPVLVLTSKSQGKQVQVHRQVNRSSWAVDQDLPRPSRHVGNRQSLIKRIYSTFDKGKKQQQYVF